MTDHPRKHPAHHDPEEHAPHRGRRKAVELVEIQSRAHRPLVFHVAGHGPVRIGAFQKVKLPAFAAESSALRQLIAEGAAMVIAKKGVRSPDDGDDEAIAKGRRERGGHAHESGPEA